MRTHTHTHTVLMVAWGFGEDLFLSSYHLFAYLSIYLSPLVS